MRLAFANRFGPLPSASTCFGRFWFLARAQGLGCGGWGLGLKAQEKRVGFRPNGNY